MSSCHKITLYRYSLDWNAKTVSKHLSHHNSPISFTPCAIKSYSDAIRQGRERLRRIFLIFHKELIHQNIFHLSYRLKSRIQPLCLTLKDRAAVYNQAPVCLSTSTIGKKNRRYAFIMYAKMHFSTFLNLKLGKYKKNVRLYKRKIKILHYLCIKYT